jgi:hypothetical protein
MNIFKDNYLLFLVLFTFILIIIIFNWIHFLSFHNYIVECFTNNNNSKNTHTVNLPLTTTYSCQNFCGPTSRCAITGQQCFTDIDCPGCQPYTPPLSSRSWNKEIPGNNGAGKLTWGITPQYSPLTSGYGTHEKIITKNMFSKPDMANFGIDTWRSSFNKERKLFDERYKPPQLKYMPDYPKRYSFTGSFIEDGPLASNAVL